LDYIKKLGVFSPSFLV